MATKYFSDQLEYLDLTKLKERYVIEQVRDLFEKSSDKFQNKVYQSILGLNPRTISKALRIIRREQFP